MKVYPISQYQAIEILRENTNKLIEHDKKCTFYGYVLDNEIVSIIGLRRTKNTLRIKNCFTKTSKRGNGYFTDMLSIVLDYFKPETATAFCTNDSVEIFKRQGFELKRTLKRKDQNIYFVRKYEKN